MKFEPIPLERARILIHAHFAPLQLKDTTQWYMAETTTGEDLDALADETVLYGHGRNPYHYFSFFDGMRRTVLVGLIAAEPVQLRMFE